MLVNGIVCAFNGILDSHYVSKSGLALHVAATSQLLMKCFLQHKHADVALNLNEQANDIPHTTSKFAFI